MNEIVNGPLESAIVDDDISTVRSLIKAQPGLASQMIQAPKLHTSGIFYWIYVGDTALHLAAAEHRVEIVDELLKAGADPNARPSATVSDQRRVDSNLSACVYQKR